jgi:hypothetical protein
MNSFGTPPNEGFIEKMVDLFPTISAQDVRNATEVATKLQKLVQKSGIFYNEPYGTVHEKVRSYLRENLPGLSERTYFLAERRIMFMYIH